MKWIRKIFGEKPIKETYSPPISNTPTQEKGIWVVHWTAYKYKYSDWADVLDKFKVFTSEMEAELFKEQIDIAHDLIGNIGYFKSRIEKQG